MSDISDTTIIRAARHQVSGKISEESVILDLDAGIYYGVNSLGSRIWELVQEPCAVGQIVEALLADFEVEPRCCLNDLLEFLADMESRGLIEVDDEASS